MDARDVETTIRDLNACITNPSDRMSEAAILLMVKLMAATINSMESATMEALANHGFRQKKVG